MIRFMLSTLRSNFLADMGGFYKDATSYILAKKSPIPIPVDENKALNNPQYLEAAPQHINTFRQILSIQFGPGVLSDFVVNWFRINGIRAAPGYDLMTKLFDIDRCDLTWVDRNPKTEDEKRAILGETRNQAEFFMGNISGKSLAELHAVLKENPDRFPTLNLEKIFAGKHFGTRPRSG